MDIFNIYQIIRWKATQYTYSMRQKKSTGLKKNSNFHCINSLLFKTIFLLNLSQNHAFMYNIDVKNEKTKIFQKSVVPVL
jgi:hypothetical protein